MDHTIEMLRGEFLNELGNAGTSADLELLRIKYLGKKGPVQGLMKGLQETPSDQRKQLGKKINDLKEEFVSSLENLQQLLGSKEMHLRLEQEKIDVTLPGRRKRCGRKHPITQQMDEILDILTEMGFSVQYGPDIDTDYYNFGALNFPTDHPARDMQDTFYLSANMLLRTQTSNIQARVMEQHKPPLRIITPGKVYRNETITARSHVFFHQIEGMYIDHTVSFADLLATLQELYGKIFHANVEMRCRPSYFPFVEPGMEVDISCFSCESQGCSLCKYTGWLEVCGAGMIHPEVLKNGDIDPEVYSGYAWGLGVERILMLKRKIKDIRLFTENDTRFLQQFTSL